MTDTAPAPSTPDDDQPGLLHVLGDLGTTLTQSEIPAPSQLGHVVGAIIKVLEHAKVTVADELYPAEPEPVSRPETQQAVNQKATDSRLERLEGALERVLGHLEDRHAAAAAPPQDSTPVAAPDESAPPDPPPPPPGDTSGEGS
jgi:hypothetical protein